MTGAFLGKDSFTFDTVNKKKIAVKNTLKGIVSRDFEWLQTILMNRLCVPDVPLEVYSFLNFRFHIVI